MKPGVARQVPTREVPLQPNQISGVRGERPRALVVVERDDIATLIEAALARLGYDALRAASRREVFDRLRDDRLDLVVVDLDLRGVGGLDVLAAAHDADPAPAAVVLLREADAERAAEWLQRGAIDYLVGPFDAASLDRDLGRASRWWKGLARQRRQLQQVAEHATHDAEQLRDVIEQRERFTVATLDALITVQEAKNPFVAGHSLRVASVSAAVAAQVGLPALEVDRVRRAGRLHDLGMIGVRERVWDKPAQLSDEEYQQVKQHTVIGARILEPLTHLGPVVQYVHTHHERWDGKGYPDAIAGHDIPLGGRIIHAAEVFDALTTRRPYQEVISPAQALIRMQELARGGLDPFVVDAFAEAIAASRALPLGRDDAIPQRERAGRSSGVAADEGGAGG